MLVVLLGNLKLVDKGVNIPRPQLPDDTLSSLEPQSMIALEVAEQEAIRVFYLWKFR